MSYMRDSDGTRLDAVAVARPLAQSTSKHLVPVGYRARTPFNSTGNSPALIQSNGTNLGTTFRVAEVAQVSGHGVVIEFCVFLNAVGVEADAGSDVTIVSCTIETAANFNIPVTFGGQLSATIKSGTSGVILLRSDPAGFSITKGQTFWVRTVVQVASGQKYPIHLIARGDPWGEGSNSDVSVAGSPTAVGRTDAWVAVSGNKLNVRMFGPSAILVQPKTPCSTLAVVCDSIGVGTGESNIFTNSIATSADHLDEGWVTRAVRDRWPHFIAGLSGTLLTSWNSSGGINSFRRRIALETMFFTHLLCELGINDLIGAASLATMQARWITAWTDLGNYGRPLYQTTITPLTTTSSDNFTTVAGQTVHSNAAARVSCNAWLRDGAPMHLSGGSWVVDVVGAVGGSVARAAYYTQNGAGVAVVTAASGPTHPLSGVIEVSDAVESSRDSGKWKAATGARIVTDAAITSGTATLTSATAAFTANDVGRVVVVAGSAAAGAAQTAIIGVLNSATSVTLYGLGSASGNAATTVSGASASIGAFGTTADGVHPSGTGNASDPGGHQLIAAWAQPVLAAVLGSQSA